MSAKLVAYCLATRSRPEASVIASQKADCRRPKYVVAFVTPEPGWGGKHDGAICELRVFRIKSLKDFDKRSAQPGNISLGGRREWRAQ